MSGRSEGGAGAAAMRIGTILTGLLFAGLGAWVAVAALDFPAPTNFGAPGPGRLPAIYGVLLAVLGVAIAGATLVGQPEPGVEAEGGLRVALLILGTAVFLFLLPHLGFLAVSLPGMFLATAALTRSWRIALVATAVLPPAIQVSFAWMLGIPLP